VAVTVDCSQPPTANDDTGTVNEDASATAVSVLTNDTDPDGGQKTIQSTTDPDHGTAAITGGGTGLTYKPDANYCNDGSPKDTFDYTLNGGDSATVSMTVDCVDDPPTASGGSATATEGASPNAISVGSLAGDIDGGPKTINSVTQGNHGSVGLTGAGSGLTYTLDESYCNNVNGPPNNPSDSFTYTLNGGATGTVSVTIVCVDDDPVASDDGPAVSGNSAANALDVLGNDTDVDAGPKAIASFTQPDHGSVSGTGGSTNAWTGLSYQPQHGYCGDDSFDYTLTPGGDTATVSVDVDCSTPPTAVNDGATVLRNAPATLLDVRANDTDPDGGPMVITNTSDPNHGTVEINFDGTALSYQPDTGYCNTPSGPTDNFTYTLNGGPTATVFMTVTCPDVPPPPTTTTTTTPQQQVQGDRPVTIKKCKKGFKRVKGKCKKKKRKRK
jgi:VCBS repeat-containing protein